ncbi:hypothetical protein OS493_022453, partial [Desmophyllum pertusum]
MLNAQSTQHRRRKERKTTISVVEPTDNGVGLPGHPCGISEAFVFTKILFLGLTSPWRKAMPSRSCIITIRGIRTTITLSHKKTNMSYYINVVEDMSRDTVASEKPGSPTITSSAGDIQATSLTVRWNTPANNGGSPITAYRLVILKGGIKIKNVNITDPGRTSLSVGGLEINTEYTVNVFARNAVFKGLAGKKAMTTKFEAEIYGLPSEVTNDTITLKWREPKNNGKVITLYTVYQRIVTDGKPGEWTRLKTITDISVRGLKVKLEKGKVYEFVVTATNELGESLKDRKIKRVLASGIPAAVEMSDTPSEVTDSTITLKWSEPQSYGREITQYTVYQRIVTDGQPVEWDKLQTITNVSVRELEVKLEKGNEYEFVVTATNIHGESSKDEGNSKRVKAIGGSSCEEEKIILHAVYVSLIIILLIIILILGVVIWKMRKRL